MKLKLLIIFTLMTNIIFSQNYKQVKVYLNELNNISELVELGIGVDHFIRNRDNSIEIFVNEDEFKNLQSSNFSYDILIDDWYKYYKELHKLSDAEKENSLLSTADKFGVTGFDYGSMGGYYILDEVYQKLDEMYTAYPSLITQRDSIGNSIENRSIYMVKISDNPTTKEEEPEVLYTALHHAREPESMMQMIYFMFYLLENYGIDDEVTYLVDNREIYFIPVVNPDGYRYNQTIAPNGGGMWRKNRRTNDDGSRGVDLNRNYSYKWNYDNQGSSGSPSNDLYRGTAPFSEPETETIRQFCINHNFKLALNYHSWGNLLITPWGYIPEETPDSILYREYASDMTKYNNYTWGASEDILYGVNGDSDDWFYGEQNEKNKILAMTPEVGNRTDYFWPPQSRIIPLAEENVYPNLYLAWAAGGYVNSSENNFDREYYFANETGTISSGFKNIGLSNIENVSAVLSSDNEFIQVTNSTLNIRDFESRAEQYFEHAFEFTVAENPPLGEKLYLTLNTFQNGILMSEEQISLIVGYPLVFLEDNADSLESKWAAESNVDQKWESTEDSYFTMPKSFTDSRIGVYLPNTESSLTLVESIDLSQVENPYLSFMTKFEIENNWDYGQVLVSIDSGSTWQAVGGSLANIASGDFQPNGEFVYDGVQHEWAEEIIDLTEFGNEQLLIKFRIETDTYVEFDGWYIDDIKFFSFIDVIPGTSEEIVLQKKYELKQNYPNPFNPSTIMSFSLEKPGFTSLKVYNILGEEIATMIQDYLGAGNHKIEFLIDNKKLTSGIYFYQLTSGEFKETKKMLMLK